MQVPGLVNVDFADVRAIMQNAGSSLMGIGTATGIAFGQVLSMYFFNLSFGIVLSGISINHNTL